MFRIKAHGVNTSEGELTEFQKRLTEEPRPIRICGAPTGSGKTYAFFHATNALNTTTRTSTTFRDAGASMVIDFDNSIHKDNVASENNSSNKKDCKTANQLGKVVFLFVPTQALAKDVRHTAESLGVPSHTWDFTQTEDAHAQGRSNWSVRKEEYSNLLQTGGIVVATIEALGNLLLGKPKLQNVYIDINDIFKAEHLVFDEAHTLTERSFGLIHILMLVVSYYYTKNPKRCPRITFLSATHSNLFQELCQENFVAHEHIAFFDEEISETPKRYIHGDVDVEVTDDTIVEVVNNHGKDLLDKYNRLLLVYDSLKEFSQDSTTLSQLLVDQFGLKANQIIAINSQDRQASSTLDSRKFDSGLKPEDRHRVIIGTSAVEMGVNVKANAAILHAGCDSASLIQRIGRVARGNTSGAIYIAKERNAWVERSHLNNLKNLQGELSIKEIQTKLGDCLRQVSFKRAKNLGSAYWSMIGRKERHLFNAIKAIYQELNYDSNHCPGKHLNKLWVIRQDVSARFKEPYEEWLEHIDELLCDLRNFPPTATIVFQGGVDIEVITDSMDRIQRDYRRPDQVGANGELIFNCTRDRALREKSSKIVFDVLLPYQKGSYRIKATNEFEAFKEYIAKCTNETFSKPWVKDCINFLKATQLLPRIK